MLRISAETDADGQASIREFLNTCHFGNVQAVVRSNPPQQSMDVVLHCLFRKIQMRCNLFIGKAPRDHRHQFSLASREPPVRFLDVWEKSS
jgi:hypothetical protein